MISVGMHSRAGCSPTLPGWPASVLHITPHVPALGSLHVASQSPSSEPPPVSCVAPGYRSAQLPRVQNGLLPSGLLNFHILPAQAASPIQELMSNLAGKFCFTCLSSPN